MSDKNQYPKRGETSADGLLYTHTDGSVHYRVYMDMAIPICDDCSMLNCLSTQLARGCTMRDQCAWSRLENAYVPSDEEREACEMARAMIAFCGPSTAFKPCTMCKKAGDGDRTCPARVYLAAHGEENAWSVQ